MGWGGSRYPIIHLRLHESTETSGGNVITRVDQTTRSVVGIQKRRIQQGNKINILISETIKKKKRKEKSLFLFRWKR